MRYSKIAIVMAMEEEALPLIEYYALKKIRFHNPITVYGNQDLSLILSLNGKSKEFNVDNIGSQAATLNTHIVIEKYNPGLIINCGTAGGFKSRNANIGDVYIADKCICYHDRRIPLPGGFEEYGYGNYQVISSDVLAAKCGLKQGIISTGDAFDASQEDLDTMKKNNVDVKEMEAAAIAWVCQLNGIDFTALKAITDFVDEPHKTGDDFLSNLNFASSKLKEKTIKLIDFLSGLHEK